MLAGRLMPPKDRSAGVAVWRCAGVLVCWSGRLVSSRISSGAQTLRDLEYDHC